MSTPAAIVADKTAKEDQADGSGSEDTSSSDSDDDKSLAEIIDAYTAAGSSADDDD